MNTQRHRVSAGRPKVTTARSILRLLAPVCAGLALCSCVSNKYRVNSALDVQPDWLRRELGHEPVQVRLDAVIVYQGPGSWKKAAYWDEVLVSIANPGPEPIVLRTVSLVDYGDAVVLAGDEPWALEKASLTQRDRYTKAGVNFVLNTLGYATATYGVVGAGAMIGAATSSTWAGVATGATIGLAAVPIGAIVIHANNQTHKHAIEREFTRRRLPLPCTLAPGQSSAGSLFFPMTVGPKVLRLTYEQAGAPRVLDLPVPMLSGMHRR